ncbi:PP2C family protein-serine/threonine phosphatase [Heliomicrobium gestii]|nr:protein phosphatase 2C domain-containing protein [Heliomicrobium gestii]
MFAITDCGLVREHNEDAFLIHGDVFAQGECHVSGVEEDFLIAVADGVGGASAGEVASRMVLTAMAAMPLNLSCEAIDRYIGAVNEQVLRYGEKHPPASGLGATLAGILCRQGKVLCFHVGDSRVYRYRDGYIKQMTRDHSLVETLYQMGTITREEMSGHPQKNRIWKYLGSGESIQADVQMIRGNFERGDVYLLCTDGLSDLVPPEEMEMVLSAASTLREGALALMEAARRRGAPDNVTLAAAIRHGVRSAL